MSGLHGEEEFHKERLKAFCRRCGNPFDQNSNERHIPQPATKFTKEILQIDNLDVTCDNEYTHPPFLCRRCVAKIQRFKKGKNRNQPKFPGDQGKYFVFKTHSENLLSKGTCSMRAQAWPSEKGHGSSNLKFYKDRAKEYHSVFLVLVHAVRLGVFVAIKRRL